MVLPVNRYHVCVCVFFLIDVFFWRGGREESLSCYEYCNCVRVIFGCKSCPMEGLLHGGVTPPYVL